MVGTVSTSPQQATDAAPLHFASIDEVRQELVGDTAVPELDLVLATRADKFVATLLALDPKDFKAREDGKFTLENMGLDVQRESTKKSQMLKQPIKKLQERAEQGGDVANALIDLKMKVEEIDPGKFDFDAGWFSRLVGSVPGVGTPLKRYFTKFESAQTVIEAIIRSLEQGRDQLSRDNVTMSEDQHAMRTLTYKLEDVVKLGQAIDAKLEHALKTQLQEGSDRHRFVAEELLFPLRQRVIDLQQQLAVNQQGVLATELIIRNNKELARGVNRTLNVTVSALHVGATVAIALANQKDVIDKVDAVNKTTSDLIAGTAERLRTQGAQIHKQAASAQLDMDKLKASFVSIRAAMDDISNFRIKALPQMAQTVIELDRLTTDAEATIKKQEHGNQMKPQLSLELDSIIEQTEKNRKGE